MRLVSITCPHCGAKLQTTANVKMLTCGYCNNDVMVDDEVKRVCLADAEQAGYEFEMGRQRALKELREDEEMMKGIGPLVYYDHTDKYSLDPWNMVYNSNDCVETALFPEMKAATKTERPEIAQVHRIIEEELTETERNLVDLHFGDGMKLVDISQVEAAQTGKAPTVRALSMRKRRLLDKVAKHLGVKHESRWVGPKSKQHEIDERKNLDD